MWPKVQPLPKLEDMLALLVVQGNVALCPLQADGHLAMVRNAVAGILAVLVEAQATLPHNAKDILPGPGETG